MAKSFALGVGADGTEESLEVVPDEVTRELLELEQEHVAQDAREKGTAEEKEHARKRTVKGSAEVSADVKQAP